MPTFSLSSRARLLTCHPDLQRLFNKVIERRDCTIISGQRGEAEQNELYRKGLSQLKYPHSKHNGKPSEGVDVMRYFDCTPHIRWDDMEACYEFVGFVNATAEEMGIDVINGADWNDNLDFHDEGFLDIAHWQLVTNE